MVMQLENERVPEDAILRWKRGASECAGSLVPAPLLTSVCCHFSHLCLTGLAFTQQSEGLFWKSGPATECSGLSSSLDRASCPPPLLCPPRSLGSRCAEGSCTNSRVLGCADLWTCGSP